MESNYAHNQRLISPTLGATDAQQPSEWFCTLKSRAADSQRICFAERIEDLLLILSSFCFPVPVNFFQVNSSMNSCKDSKPLGTDGSTFSLLAAVLTQSNVGIFMQYSNYL